jgi:hypothetical protein
MQVDSSHVLQSSMQCTEQSSNPSPVLVSLVLASLNSPCSCRHQLFHTQVKPAHSGLAWDRTKAWVVAAAEVAPMTTEALLHSFLTSSESLPGATPPAWLAGQQQLESAAMLGLDSRAAESTGDAFGTGFVGDGVMAPDAVAAAAAAGGHLGGARADGSGLGQGMSGSGQARFATQAAFRRAADLLQACGAARRRQQLGYAGDGAYEGALGLTRKLHYTGYVQGLMNGRGSAAAAAAAAVGHTGITPVAAGRSIKAAAAAAEGRSHGTPSLHNLQGVDEDGEAAANGALAAEASRASMCSVDSEASVQSEMAVAEEVRSHKRHCRQQQLQALLHTAPCCRCTACQ